MNADRPLSAQKRKKAALKARQQSERRAERTLDVATEEAIVEALRLAPIVASVPLAIDSDHVIDVEFASISEAQYARKRIHEVLRADEWLDEVRVWVWNADEHQRSALSERGRTAGFELRIEQVPK